MFVWEGILLNNDDGIYYKTSSTFTTKHLLLLLQNILLSNSHLILKTIFPFLVQQKTQEIRI